MRYRLLGTVQAATAGGQVAALGGHRQRLVFAVLLLHAGRSVRTTTLVEQVWGEDAPPTARRTLQAYISRLRAVLGTDVITATRGGYALHAAPEEIDAVVFERLATEGRRLLLSDPAAAAAQLRDALAMWRGAAWGELAEEPALLWDADRLRELRLAVVEDRVAADLECGEEASLVGELRGLIAAHPLRERLRASLMIALYRQGQTAEALSVFEEGRCLLADQLGADPGHELERVHQRILQRDRSLSVRPAGRPEAPADHSKRNPYKGLRAFDEEDADAFFGREPLVAELRDLVVTDPLVVLVGPSGSGKSSVVSAGLIPALRTAAAAGSDEWRIASMTPGAHPFVELEAALAQAASRAGGAPFGQTPWRGDDLDLLRAVAELVPLDHGRVLLVIDQLEELFLQVSDDAVRDRFLRNLVEAIEDPHSRLAVVAVLRGDLLDRPMSHSRLGPLVMGHLCHVPPLAPAEVESACVRPARQAGVAVEPELAAELVAEVAANPGVLPVFQYTLTELFDGRSGDALTLHDYRQLGGVHGVITRRAEQTFASLAEPVQVACQQVLLRLVSIGDEGAVGRRRVLRAELDDLAVEPVMVDAVLDRFSAARLLAFDRDPRTGAATAEIAHEALLREWPRLHDWIEQCRDDLRVQRWTAAAAAEWEASGRSEAHLLSGARLEMAARWRRRSLAAPTAAELALVDASLAQQEQRRVEEEVRRHRELELMGRLRKLVAVLAIATVLAATLGGLAMRQRARAEAQSERLAVAVELERARALAASAVVSRRLDPQRSLLLALHAVNLIGETGEPVPREIVEALHWALQANRVAYPRSATQTLGATSPEGLRGFFELPMDDLYAHARANVSRDLTRSECSAALGSPSCPALPTSLPALESDSPHMSRLGGGAFWGTQVTVATPSLDADGGALRSELGSFHDRTGIEVVVTETEDVESLVARGIADHRPPDIAFVPDPDSLPSPARYSSVGRGPDPFGTAVYAVALTDRPEVRELMRLLERTEYPG